MGWGRGDVVWGGGFRGEGMGFFFSFGNRHLFLLFFSFVFFLSLLSSSSSSLFFVIVHLWYRTKKGSADAFTVFWYLAGNEVERRSIFRA